MKASLWTAFLVVACVAASEDLLDEYVKHVQESSGQRHTIRSWKWGRYVPEKDLVGLRTYDMPRAKTSLSSFSSSVTARRIGKSKRQKRTLYAMATQEGFVRERQRLRAIKNKKEMNELLQLTSRDGRTHKKAYGHRRRRAVAETTSGRVPMRWTRSQVLDERGDVVLSWQPRHREVAFRLEARTRGYVGIGFSPTGGMAGADVAVGWVDDVTGQAFLLDCHVPAEKSDGRPVRDEVENYTLMRGTQNGTHTVLEFRRALDTCDTDDYVLGTDTVRVIWALHESDPGSFDELPRHERRGEQSLYLLAPPAVDNPENTRHWDVALKDFAMPDGVDTFYWCKIFKGPTLNTKHHIVSYEPILGRTHRPYVHHVIVHECRMSGSSQVPEWESSVRSEGAVCYGPRMPRHWELCTTPLVAWAVGGKGEVLPEHVGIPLAETVPKYYMLEVHFDNPEKKRPGAVDTTGLRVHYTHRLRKHDAGILSTGVALTSLHIVPPKQPEYKSAGYCSTDCTKTMFPKDGINVVSVLLHSHRAGRKMSLRHVRGGRELTPIARDDRYDFAYQQTRTLGREVTILPGDGLITECTYSTMDRPRPTLAGYSTSDEMCLAFVLHYPRSDLATCYSMPPVRNFFETFGVKGFYGFPDLDQLEPALFDSDPDATSWEDLATTPTSRPPALRLPAAYPPGFEDDERANRQIEQAIRQSREYTIDGEGVEDVEGAKSRANPFDRLVILDPYEFRNKTFRSHLDEIPWQEQLLTKRIEESLYAGQHLTFCKKKDYTLATPETVVALPNLTKHAPEDSTGSQFQCSYRLQPSGYSIAASLPSPLAVLAPLLLLTTCI